jgi:hypothetical protein
MATPETGPAQQRESLHDVGVADVVEAWHRLGGGDRRAAAVAALLGFDLRAATAASAAGAGPMPGAPASDAEGSFPRRGRADPVTAPMPVPQSAPVPEARPRVEPWRRLLTPSGVDRGSVESAAAVPLAREEPGPVEYPHESLFRPAVAARIVEAAVATDLDGDDIDVERVVVEIASRQPLDHVPRLVRPSLFRGVQLLVDYSPSMQPFRWDCADLSATVRRTVGAGLVDQQVFRRCPTLGTSRRARGPFRPFVPPPPRTPVLVLTDLGPDFPGQRGPSSVTRDWLALRDLLAARDSNLVLFVPLPPDRWPARLRARVTMVAWDRPATVSSTLSAIRRTRKVARG